jgi:hypothetical protein
MNLPDRFHSVFRVPPLTRPRMAVALVFAAGADGLQLLLAPFGWFGADQVIDCVTMVVISRLIGFHILLLPTFVINFVPVLDELPTWIACTAAVIVLRKREQRTPPPPPQKPIIDV